MDAFTWIDGERLIRFGRGAAGEAPALLAERGFDGYALLATPRARAAAPDVAAGAAVLLDVPGGRVAEVAAQLLDATQRRPLVAVGGGRSIDTAKAIGAVHRLPVAAIPTTLSGAELTPIHRLPAGAPEVPRIRASLVVVDPELAASQPAPERAASALNALAHAAESLWTPRRNPVSDLAALEAARLLARGVEHDDREALALGSTLAAYAMGSAGIAVLHVLGQSLAQAGGLPHAGTYAVLLPHVLRLLGPSAPGPLARLGEALGGDAAERAAALTARTPATRLRQLGADEPGLERALAAALRRAELAATPGAPGEAELRDLLRAAH